MSAPAEWRATNVRNGARTDPGVVLAALALLSLGVVMSYSATAPLALDARVPPHFVRHAVAVVAGIAAALITSRLPTALWRRAALPLWLLGVALLALTAVSGTEVNGARRWLAIPGLAFRFQPAEPARLFTLIAVAAVLASRQGRGEVSAQQIWRAAVLMLPPVIFMLAQPDLGSAVLLMALSACLVWLAGSGVLRIAWPALAAVPILAGYVWWRPHAWRRLTAYLDPWSDPQGAGFQLIQSLVGFARGGLSGVDIGSGRQKLHYLPEVHTDFILSLVGEELGALGVLAVLAAFAALGAAGLRIARRAPDRFSLLLAAAATGTLVLPALLNAAVVMGVVPTKGLTLPFLSYGRSSLVTCCAAVGILLGVARSASVPREPEKTRCR